MNMANLRAPFLLILVFLASCNSSLHKQSTQKQIRWSVGEINTFDSALATDRNALTLVPLVIETLYQYSYNKLPPEAEPLLAEGMPELSQDQKTYKIHVKKNVFFQDDPCFQNGKGRELIAQDFIYAWKRIFLPHFAVSRRAIFEENVLGMSDFKKQLYAAPANQQDKAFSKSIEGLNALDDHTIEIRLKAPYPLFQTVLSSLVSAPVPHEAVERYGQDELSHRMVGTGPFRLMPLAHDNHIFLTKNPNFRKELYSADGQAKNLKPLPFVDEIDFQIVKEEQPGWLHFLKGDLDSYGIPKDELDSVIPGGVLSAEIRKKGIRIQIAQDLLVRCLAFNMKDSVVGKNALLRRAISLAIDRDKWIKIFLNGHAVKATGLIPDGIPGKPIRKKLPLDYDLEAAKKLMLQAGFPGGKNLPIIRYDASGANSSSRMEGEFIAKELKEIGISVEVNLNTGPAFMQKMHNSNLIFFSGGWLSVYPDPESFLKLGYGKFVAPGSNVVNWVNPKYDRLYERIVAMQPSAQRNALINEAEELLLAEAAWVPLFYPEIVSLEQPWLLNYKPQNRLAYNFLKYLDIDPNIKADRKN